MKNKVLVLGAGVSGISCAYHLEKLNNDVIIYDKLGCVGGLCAPLLINNFIFDRFVHLSFSESKEFLEEVVSGVEYYSHKPDCSNYDRGLWIKHPAQNNLFPLQLIEKLRILMSFVKRNRADISEIQNYGEWLNVQFGEYFAKSYPYKYTRKYWGCEPEELETRWVGKRMHIPSLREVLKGAFLKNKKSYYYGKEMCYPKHRSFWGFFENFASNLDIRLNKEITKIDTINKQVLFSDGTLDIYDTLISSIPLPEYIRLLDDVPLEVVNAAKRLSYTSGYTVSIGLKGNLKKEPGLWFYIYDEDIPFARVYIASKKSLKNAPSGYSSLQAEIYFIGENPFTPDELKNKTVESLVKMDLFEKEQIHFAEINYEKYANIVFNHGVYANRKIVLDYLKSKGIYTIGRFGKWEYFWSDQAWLDGKEIAQLINQGEMKCR